MSQLKLVKIDENMGHDVYDMYQDIPKKEIGSSNDIYGVSFVEYKNIMKKRIKNENIPMITSNQYMSENTKNRYILFENKYPIGEIAIITTINDFWKNKGSQIFYKIRLSKRNKGYGTQMLALALEECRKMDMKQVRLNCDINNYASKRVIIKNGGKLDYCYKNNYGGTSESYIIMLNERMN